MTDSPSASRPPHLLAFYWILVAPWSLPLLFFWLVADGTGQAGGDSSGMMGFAALLVLTSVVAVIINVMSFVVGAIYYGPMSIVVPLVSTLLGYLVLFATMRAII